LNVDWVLEVEIPVTGFTSSSDYPTRLEFKLDKDSGLGVLEVARHLTSLGAG